MCCYQWDFWIIFTSFSICVIWPNVCNTLPNKKHRNTTWMVSLVVVSTQSCEIAEYFQSIMIMSANKEMLIWEFLSFQSWAGKLQDPPEKNIKDLKLNLRLISQKPNILVSKLSHIFQGYYQEVAPQLDEHHLNASLNNRH